MRRVAALTTLALALMTGFGAGFATGRLVGVGGEREPGEDIEIREGLQSHINPLLECEIANERLYAPLRPFSRRLGELVASLEKGQGLGRIAVYYRDLNNGPWVGHHEKREYVPASLAKLPVVIACYRQAEVDPDFLSRRIVYEGLVEEREPGFLNPESNLQRGKAYTIDELILRVAKYSDNAASLLLAQALPPRILQNVYADLGIDPERLNVGEFMLSPREYGAFFRVLYNASYLNKRFSEQALQYLEQSTFELGLVAGVRDGTPVSHKFGVWEEPASGASPPLQLHDCGIVYHPRRPYLVCVMTAGDNYVRMTSAIAAISRFIFEEVDGAVSGPGAREAPAGPKEALERGAR